MRYSVAAALALAVLLGYHGYYVLADFGWSIRVADAALSGVERFILYAIIAGLMLQPLLCVAARAAGLMLVFYGAIEAGQVAICQGAHGLTKANLRLGADACDALTGLPVGGSIAFIAAMVFAVMVIGSYRRANLLSVPYDATGVFVGYERRGRSVWKVLAALITHPYAGCVWFRQGIGYRFDRRRGCMIADPKLRWQSFKLRPYLGNPELLRPGLPWSLKHNCVTLR